MDELLLKDLVKLNQVPGLLLEYALTSGYLELMFSCQLCQIGSSNYTSLVGAMLICTLGTWNDYQCQFGLSSNLFLDKL